MNDDIKTIICFLFFILCGVGFMLLLTLDGGNDINDVEVHNVPVLHSNSNGTVDMFIYPVID